MTDTLGLALVGVGPTGSMLLERLAANLPELLAGRPLRIHLVDPFRAGTGRVWRPDNPAALWMNSLAADVTLFTDHSVRIAGPVRPGPTLHEWCGSVADDELATLTDPAVAAEVRRLGPTSFPTRRVQSAYLDWFHRQALAGLPPEVEVVAHPEAAVDLVDDGDRQVVTLASGEHVVADVVVLALGHLDAAPGGAELVLAEQAAAAGLVHVAAGHTAEQDLSVLEPGADVLVSGFGQAFTDLLVLVTEGRGGRFVEEGGGRLRYEPSGREPVLHVGSRRGVPYRSKIDYQLRAPLAPLPHFLTDEVVGGLASSAGPVRFRDDVWPLLGKELAWAWYHQLAAAHPQRVRGSWDDLAGAIEALPLGPELEARLAALVPDAADRLDVPAIDRPLAGVRLASAGAAHGAVAAHVAADVARKTDPAFSQDLALFHAMLRCLPIVGMLAASPVFSVRSRYEDVLPGWWYGFFMYVASGPPPARLRQLLAVAEAGLVRFAGAGFEVAVEQGRYVGRSRTHPDEVGAGAFVDARIPAASVARTTDVLLGRLRDRGEVREERLAEGEWAVRTGKVEVAGGDLRVVRADGSRHPRRHAVGSFTSRPAAGAFARPSTNAPAFRQNDAVARSVLGTLAAIGASLSG